MGTWPKSRWLAQGSFKWLYHPTVPTSNVRLSWRWNKSLEKQKVRQTSLCPLPNFPKRKDLRDSHWMDELSREKFPMVPQKDTPDSSGFQHSMVTFCWKPAFICSSVLCQNTPFCTFSSFEQFIPFSHPRKNFSYPQGCPVWLRRDGWSYWVCFMSTSWAQVYRSPHVDRKLKERALYAVLPGLIVACPTPAWEGSADLSECLRWDIYFGKLASQGLCLVAGREGSEEVETDLATFGGSHLSPAAWSSRTSCDPGDEGYSPPHHLCYLPGQHQIKVSHEHLKCD